MTKLFSSLIVATFFVSPVMAELASTAVSQSTQTPPKQGGTDIIINSGGLGFSNDFAQVYLTTPTVNMKQAINSTKMQPITVDKFISLWTAEDKSSDFDKVQPNAILSSWDEDNNYLESSFIITSAEKQGDKLALNVQYLTNPNESITPISINSKPAMKTDLSEFLSGTDQAAVTILVDCTSVLDGRC